MNAFALPFRFLLVLAVGFTPPTMSCVGGATEPMPGSCGMPPVASASTDGSESDCCPTDAPAEREEQTRCCCEPGPAEEPTERTAPSNPLQGLVPHVDFRRPIALVCETAPVHAGWIAPDAAGMPGGTPLLHLGTLLRT